MRVNEQEQNTAQHQLYILAINSEQNAYLPLK